MTTRDRPLYSAAMPTQRSTASPTIRESSNHQIETTPQMPLDPQRILFIGIPPGAIPVRTSKFFDMFNVNDFQLVAWNAETFVAETQEKTGQSFQSHHHPFVYRRFKELYEEKMTEILNWIRYGNVLIIFPYLFTLP
jgi:hypothetical protein